MTTTNAPMSASAFEETPLLGQNARFDEVQVQIHDALYDRFTPAKKRTIVALCAWAGVVPFLVSGSIIPAIPQIVRDLHSTPAVVSSSVGLAVFATSLGNLWWAAYSGFYGRRPIYLCSLPTLCIGSLGVACSSSVHQFLICRIIQAFGCSSGLSLGAAVIGDIYRLEERGTAMGVFFGAVCIGPAIAPFLGGTAAHYASWRVMHIGLCMLSGIAALLMYCLLPETAHPGSRGCDHMLAEEVTAGRNSKETGFKWVWLNPFASLKLLRAPNLLAVCLGATFALLTDFVMCVPLSYTLGQRYHITNEALIGLLVLPVGLGNIIGAPLAGRISDHTVVRWRARRKGEWVPEDRLRATLVGAGVMVPMSVLLSGVITSQVPGHIGIGLNVLVLLVNGIGVDLVLSPVSAYFVDVLHARSAEVMSASESFQFAIIAVVCTCVLPAIEMFGLIITDTSAAVVAWTGFLLLLLTIWYGDRMRSWTNIEWSTPKDN